MRFAISFIGVLLTAFAPILQQACAVEPAAPTDEERDRCEAAASDLTRKRCLQAHSVKGLRFPDQAEEWSAFSSNMGRMAIFKPKGAGPFPALLLLHSCGALDFDPRHMRYWASRALEEGYVAFIVDSWTQRGLSQGTCFGVPAGFAALPVRTRDAYEALRHVSKFPFVDSSRVAAMGFSHGGRVAHLLASGGIAAAYSDGKRRFAASVAVYGQCFSHDTGATFVLPDSDAPLLSLLGERDEDGDPRECLPRLQKLRESGAPVDWYVFPNTGHAWDQPKFSPPRRIRQLGSGPDGVLFGYDPRVADESRERAFAFLARYLKAARN